MTVLLATMLALLQPALTPAPASAAPSGGAAASQCSVLAEQEAALLAQVDSLNAQVDALSAQIAAHNVQVIDNTNAAAVAAYNATADALNAQKDALNTQVRDVNQQITALDGRETSCEVASDAALAALASDHPGDWSYERDSNAIASLTQQLTGVSRDVPPAAPNSRGEYLISDQMRPIYGPVRSASPATVPRPSQLQGQTTPSVGDLDPAYGGASIRANNSGGAAVAVDHIVPLTEIFSLPGFTQLTPENMLSVVNTPLNLQWLSARANSAKRSGPLTRMIGVDQDWLEEQQALHDEVRERLQTAIDELLDLQQTLAG